MKGFKKNETRDKKFIVDQRRSRKANGCFKNKPKPLRRNLIGALTGNFFTEPLTVTADTNETTLDKTRHDDGRRKDTYSVLYSFGSVSGFLGGTIIR